MKFRSPRLPKQFEGSDLTRPPSGFFFKVDRRRSVGRAAQLRGEARGLTTVETLPDAPSDNKCGPPSDVPTWQGFYRALDLDQTLAFIYVNGPQLPASASNPPRLCPTTSARCNWRPGRDT